MTEAALPGGREIAAALAGAAAQAEPAPKPLPRLRQDIDVLAAPREKNGAPSWTLFDPARNLFFRIGWLEFEMLSRWDEGTVEALAARVSRETRFSVEPSDVEDFASQLIEDQLTASRAGQSWRTFAKAQARKKHGPIKWMLHHYLFFRIPLVRPDRVLGQAERWTRFMFTRGFVVVLIAAFLLGLYLAGRQWDVFVARLHSLTSLQTLPWFLAAITFTKLLHETGHAIVAKRHGVRVPAAGLAFMVFWPMLYTDATDAWRLTSRHARMAIDGAGVAAELVLAVLALLLWSFLPDGATRDAALMVATVTWITTLAVNLSPFMRFDGYFLLADFVDIPNLQARAFALTRWWIRRTFLGIDDPEPEPVSPTRLRWMIAYSIAVWIYRLVLFLGIAIIVYHFFIKIVGILLFLVEIFWFVLIPIFREVGVWWRRRSAIRTTPSGAVAAGLMLAGLCVFFAPWSTRVEAPAVARASSFVRLFPTAPGRIDEVSVSDGDWVAAGDLLFKIASPDIDSRIAIARAKIEESEREMAASSYDQEAAERLGVLAGEIATRRREIAAQEELRSRLVIRAPMAGEIRNLPADLRPGRWVGDDTPLGLLTDRKHAAVVAYVNEEDVRRIAPGAEARFYAGAPDAEAVAARVIEVERVDARLLDDRDLAAQRGGTVEAQHGEQGAFRPRHALYKVRLGSEAPIERATRGVAQIAGEPQSLATRVWRSFVAVAIRESGF